MDPGKTEAPIFNMKILSSNQIQLKEEIEYLKLYFKENDERIQSIFDAVNELKGEIILPVKQ